MNCGTNRSLVFFGIHFFVFFFWGETKNKSLLASFLFYFGKNVFLLFWFKGIVELNEGTSSGCCCFIPKISREKVTHKIKILNCETSVRVGLFFFNLCFFWPFLMVFFLRDLNSVSFFILFGLLIEIGFSVALFYF